MIARNLDVLKRGTDMRDSIAADFVDVDRRGPACFCKPAKVRAMIRQMR